MSFVVSLKVVRLFLAISVSVWLAGGCLFGCGNTAMAATGTAGESPAVEGESCHTARAHDCCAAKPEPAKQPAVKTQNLIKPAQTDASTTLTSLPRGMMTDCPLVISATAVTSKSHSLSPELAHATNATLPLMENSGVIAERHAAAPYLPNRGPTYLRCCVFLI